MDLSTVYSPLTPSVAVCISALPLSLLISRGELKRGKFLATADTNPLTAPHPSPPLVILLPLLLTAAQAPYCTSLLWSLTSFYFLSQNICFVCIFPLWLDSSEFFSTFLCPVNSLPSLNLNSKNAFLSETFPDSSREIRSPVTHLEAHSLCSPLTTSLHSGSPVDSEMERQEHRWQHLEGVQSILTDMMSEHTQFKSHFSVSSCLSSSLQLLYHIPHLNFFVPKCFSCQ